MRRIHQPQGGREEFVPDLDEIAREGARRMLAEALEAEIRDYIETARGERGEHGRALVVRNGYANDPIVLTASPGIIAGHDASTHAFQHAGTIPATLASSSPGGW